MSDNVTHTITITGNGGLLKAEFTCHGDKNATCHQYPACECETWNEDHPHPTVPHDECWMQGFFDNGSTDPMDSTAGPETLTEAGYKAGMSGEIKTYFCQEYIEWKFLPATEGKR